MVEYPLAKKAYIVGLKEDVRYYGFPDSGAQIVHVDADKGRNAAKYKFSKTEYEDYVNLSAVRCESKDLYLFEGAVRSMNAIKQTLELREWRKQMVETVEK